MINNWFEHDGRALVTDRVLVEESVGESDEDGITTHRYWRYIDAYVVGRPDRDGRVFLTARNGVGLGFAKTSIADRHTAYGGLKIVEVLQRFLAVHVQQDDWSVPLDRARQIEADADAAKCYGCRRWDVEMPAARALRQEARLRWLAQHARIARLPEEERHALLLLAEASHTPFDGHTKTSWSAPLRVLLPSFHVVLPKSILAILQRLQALGMVAPGEILPDTQDVTLRLQA
ncbi:hypothetical protein [Adonisia turfae]